MSILRPNRLLLNDNLVRNVRFPSDPTPQLVRHVRNAPADDDHHKNDDILENHDERQPRRQDVPVEGCAVVLVRRPGRLSVVRIPAVLLRDVPGRRAYLEVGRFEDR